MEYFQMSTFAQTLFIPHVCPWMLLWSNSVIGALINIFILGVTQMTDRGDI